MAPRLVFHVGLAKTGTTSIQHDCHRHRRLLASHGVLYPRACEGPMKNHSPLAASYLAHRPHDPTIAVRPPSRTAAVAALTAEIDASACRVALVSSEHLSIHFDPYEADQLAEDFAAYAPTIVVAIREPYGRFLSMWNTHVTAGGRLTLEEFARSLLVQDNRFFSIREILKVWRAAFGDDRVRLVDYDGAPDVGAAVLHECGVAVPLPPGRRRRASLPLDAIVALRAVNAAIVARQGAPPESLAIWAQRSAFSALARRSLLRRQLSAQRSGQKSATTRPIVSLRTMAALDAIYANDSAFLAETYGHALASTRERYVVGTPVAADDEAADAQALLKEVSRGLWGPSETVMGLVERFGPSVSRLRDLRKRSQT